MSCEIEDAMHAVPFVFMTVRSGVGRPIIFLALLVINVNWERFLNEMLLKTLVEEHNRMG